MDHKYFLQAYTLINTSLVNQVMDRTYNSVGSNVFFEFGKQQEIVFQNGRRSLRKEWCIWLSWTSWRISQHNKYIVGSGENIQINIQTYLEQLLGKRFQSAKILSQFLDVEFSFEDGYKITTFFNRITEDQWLVFFPDRTEIVIDCSSDKEIQSIQDLSKQVEIKNRYEIVDFLVLNTEVQQVLFSEQELSRLICTDDFVIDLGSSAWRLEKDNEYVVGRLDHYFGDVEGDRTKIRNKLLSLVGKKMKCLSIDASRMDGQLEFDDGYVLEIFTHVKTGPWKIYRRKGVVFSANIDV